MAWLAPGGGQPPVAAAAAAALGEEWWEGCAAVGSVGSVGSVGAGVVGVVGVVGLGPIGWRSMDSLKAARSEPRPGRLLGVVTLRWSPGPGRGRPRPPLLRTRRRRWGAAATPVLTQRRRGRRSGWRRGGRDECCCWRCCGGGRAGMGSHSWGRVARVLGLLLPLPPPLHHHVPRPDILCAWVGRGGVCRVVWWEQRAVPRPGSLPSCGGHLVAAVVGGCQALPAAVGGSAVVGGR